MDQAESCDCTPIFLPLHFSGMWFMAFIRYSKCVIQTLGCWFVNTDSPACLSTRDSRSVVLGPAAQHLLGTFINCLFLSSTLTY